MANEGITIESLTYSTLEGALEVMRKSFFIYENVSTGCDLLSEPGASEELEQLNIMAAYDGVSLVAKNQDDQVVGVCINKLNVHSSENQKSYLELFSEQCKYKSSKCLVDFMISMDKRQDFFKQYNTNCTMDILSLATLPEYKKRGIGEYLVASSYDSGQQSSQGKDVKVSAHPDGKTITNADAIPSALTTIMTSDYSQKICVNLGFEAFAKESYDNFTFDGKKFSERIMYGSKTAQVFAKPFEKC
ncbi:hypothetical protein KQX54_014758 [Cotesia glomerata]|uniref:N-acetyltransferase domain-containing protein n=3 Tax=Cotesia glomerata TaxID=32391 RepID=A0AAV7IMZ3_COTGL|nr:hypothetical protein KQX54_014758 [Cotesia glomerata]